MGCLIGPLQDNERAATNGRSELGNDNSGSRSTMADYCDRLSGYAYALVIADFSFSAMKRLEKSTLGAG